MEDYQYQLDMTDRANQQKKSAAVTSDRYNQNSNSKIEKQKKAEIDNQKKLKLMEKRESDAQESIVSVCKTEKKQDWTDGIKSFLYSSAATPIGYDISVLENVIVIPSIKLSGFNYEQVFGYNPEKLFMNTLDSTDQYISGQFNGNEQEYYGGKAAADQVCQFTGQVGMAVGFGTLIGSISIAPSLKDIQMSGGEECAVVGGLAVAIDGTVALAGAGALFGGGFLTDISAEQYQKNIDKYNSTGAEGDSNTSWYKDDGSINYPPDNGAVSGTEVQMTLQPGQKIVRYGNIGEDSNFVTQAGVNPDTLSLPPTTDPAIYQEFDIIKPLPETIQSTVAPWGGSTGGGLQYELSKPIMWYFEHGYIK